MDEKRGPKLLYDTVKSNIVKRGDITKMSERPIRIPREGSKSDKFCNFVLAGHDVKKALELAGMSTNNHQIILSKFRPYLLAKIKESSVDIMAEHILKAKQRVVAKEAMTDDNTYLDWLKAEHNFAKDLAEMGMGIRNAPSLTLVIEKPEEEPQVKTIDIDADKIQTT